jgi:DNA-binding XRE family transcriptional regulator
MTNQLKAARILKGLSQKQVAEIIGISRTHYNGIEREKTKASFKVYQDLMKYFNITLLNIPKHCLSKIQLHVYPKIIKGKYNEKL